VSLNIPQLVIYTKTGIERLNLENSTTWTFGRSPVNQVHLPENLVSRHHAKLEIINQRYCYFVDLNSRNGSTINGKRVTRPVLLKHGDRIQLGKTTLIFQHSLVTAVGQAVPPPSQQGLMLQACATQGKIWQEVFLSQKISLLWSNPGTDLAQKLDLNAAANVLPLLVVIDRQAYNGNLLEFCAWSRHRYPALPLLLTDSGCTHIDHPERQSVQELGIIDLMPMMQPSALVSHHARFQACLQCILGQMNQWTFNETALSQTLKSLEESLTAFVGNAAPSAGDQAIAEAQVVLDPWEPEEQTALNSIGSAKPLSR
jgi:hypothetical protein